MISQAFIKEWVTNKTISYFSTKAYVVGTQKNCLNEMVLFEHPKHMINSDVLPAYPASFTQNFVSGMQSFYFSESQDAMVFQTCHEK